MAAVSIMFKMRSLSRLSSSFHKRLRRILLKNTKTGLRRALFHIRTQTYKYHDMMSSKFLAEMAVNSGFVGL